jgi:hypothetical protein
MDFIKNIAPPALKVKEILWENSLRDILLEESKARREKATLGRPSPMYGTNPPNPENQREVLSQIRRCEYFFLIAVSANG